MLNRKLFEQQLAEMSNNQQQIEAIKIKETCVVLAGPGSGKTRTLTMAIARALEEDVKEPRGVACITYNNECAKEIESRLGLLGIDFSERVFIGTVHSFTLTQVVIPYARCTVPGFPHKVNVASDNEINHAKKVAYEQVFKRTPSSYEMKGIWLRASSKRRSELDRTRLSWKNPDPQVAHYIEAYEQNLRQRGLIDFDDMPIIALKIINDNQWVAKALKAKYPVLFVDEYQDLGKALHEIVLRLSFGVDPVRLLAVGDPDQSIYRFIGAHPELLKELALRSDVKSILLPFNYRCGSTILSVSNAALGEEREYVTPPGSHAGEVTFHPVVGDENSQSVFIMREIIPNLILSGTPRENIAILYKNSMEGDILARAANRASISFVRTDKNALIPRSNVLARFAEECAIWVTGGWRSSRPTIERLTGIAVKMVYINKVTYGQRLEIRKTLVTFLKSSMSNTSSAHDWLESFKRDVLDGWESISTNPLTEWNTLLDLIKKVEPNEHGEITLARFCGNTEVGSVCLSTMHSSKGREFEVVILFNISGGVYPDDRDRDDPEALRESRRLFYVGITRAIKKLLLVFRKERDKRDYSPFLIEVYKRAKTSTK